MRPTPAGLDGRIATPWIASSPTSASRRGAWSSLPTLEPPETRITSAPGAISASRMRAGSSPSLRCASTHAAVARHEAAQHRGVRVVDLIEAFRLARRDHLVAGDDDPHARLLHAPTFRNAERGEQAEILRSQASARIEHDSACPDILAAMSRRACRVRPRALSRLRPALSARTRPARPRRRPAGIGSARHDSYRGCRRDRTFEGSARQGLADARRKRSDCSRSRPLSHRHAKRSRPWQSDRTPGHRSKRSLFRQHAARMLHRAARRRARAEARARSIHCSTVPTSAALAESMHAHIGVADDERAAMACSLRDSAIRADRRGRLTALSALERRAFSGTVAGV